MMGRESSTAVAPAAAQVALARFRQKALLSFLAVVAAFEHARLARMVGRNATNGDVTLLWYTAREWGAFHPRQPNYYGQNYGSNIEAVPMELLRRLGIAPSSATTLVWAAIALCGWLLLAVAAWRSSHRTLAALAVAAPALLGAYYTFFVTAIAEHQGAHFLVVAGAALLMTRPRHPSLEAGAWSLLGLGVLMERGGALLAAPVVIWYLLSAGLTRRRATIAAAGAVAPAAYVLWWWSFYRAHPDYIYFGGTSIRPKWTILVHSVGHLGRFFALFILELAPYWQLAVLATLVLALALVATRIPKYVLPGMIVPVILIWGMATPRSEGDLGKFLPPARLFVTLPYVLWFLLFLVVESGVSQRLRLPQKLPMVVIAGVVGLSLISVGLRQVEYEPRVVRLIDQTRVAAYGLHTRTKDVIASCVVLTAAARSARASIIVFTNDATTAYGCGALDYGRVDTLLASQERRTWRLYEELHRTRSSAVLAGVHPGYCDYAAPRVDRCRPVGMDAVALTFRDQSILGLLMVLGVPVRPFGPNCRPVLLVCAHQLQPSIHDLTSGSPPADGLAARRDIEGAFAMALDVNADFTTVENGSSISSKVGPNRHAFEASFHGAQVKVDRIFFLNARQAAVDFHVPTFGGLHRVRGWAINRGGSWYVDRNTFCLIEVSSTLAGERWCSPA